MTPYLVTAEALQVAAIYWGRPWWTLAADDIAEALDWWDNEERSVSSYDRG